MIKPVAWLWKLSSIDLTVACSVEEGFHCQVYKGYQTKHFVDKQYQAQVEFAEPEFPISRWPRCTGPMGHIRLMPRLVLTVTVQPTHLATRDVSIQNLVALSILVAAEKKDLG